MDQDKDIDWLMEEADEDEAAGNRLLEDAKEEEPIGNVRMARSLEQAAGFLLSRAKIRRELVEEKQGVK